MDEYKIKAGYVEIRLAADEIVDRVEEMLAWQSIAGEGMKEAKPRGILHRKDRRRKKSGSKLPWHDYLRTYTGCFRRAEPVIRIDETSAGVLTPSSLEAWESRALTPEDRSDVNVQDFEYFKNVLPVLLQRQSDGGLQYARMVEHSYDEEVPVMAGVHSFSSVGDDISSAMADDGLALTGVRYTLEAVEEVKKDQRRRWAGTIGVGTDARFFMRHHAFLLADGRFFRNMHMLALYGGRLRDMKGQALGFRMADGRRFHPDPAFMADAWANLEARREEWHVDLAFAERRTGVALPTDAVGARAFVNMLRRDTTKKGRRKSLVHWVDEHMRRRRKADAEATIAVRAHLRGQQKLDVGRFHARIWPSRDDIQRACNGSRFSDESVSAALP